MKGMSIRLIILAIVIVGISYTASTMREGGRPNTIVPPKGDTTAIPIEIGQWTGEETSLDPKLFEAIGAKSVSDRKFTSSYGQTISLHVAVFVDYELQPPHPPIICYTNNGWNIANRKVIQIDPDDKSTGEAQMLSLERDGKNIFLLYWYQFGDSAVYDTNGARKHMRSLRGVPDWPSMIKIMLQTAAPSEKEAKELLISLARPLAKWSRNLQDPKVEKVGPAESSPPSETPSEKLDATQSNETQGPTDSQQGETEKSIAAPSDEGTTTSP